MPVFNPQQTIIGSSIKYQYVNPDIPSALTSALLGTTKTAFAFSPTIVIPEITAVIGGVAKIQASGVYGSGVLSLSQTISIEMAGVEVATVSITPALNLANMPWSIDIIATILSSGMVEVSGEAKFASSLTAFTVIPIRNLTSFNMSTVGGVNVFIYNKYSGVSVGGTITARQIIVTVT